MNSIQKLLTCLLVGTVILTYSCKNDDDDPVGCNYAVETQQELDALNAAAAAYGADPTNSTKCQAFKDAYQAYLNDLQAHVECAALSGQQAELQSAINQAQAAVNDIQC